jgi:hypothetical protein
VLTLSGERVGVLGYPPRRASKFARGWDYGQVRAALALAVLLGWLGCARFQLDQPHSRSVPGRFAAIDRVPAVPGEPASWRLSGARSHGGSDAALPSCAHHLWRVRVRAARGRLLAAGRAGAHIHVETKPDVAGLARAHRLIVRGWPKLGAA